MEGLVNVGATGGFNAYNERTRIWEELNKHSKSMGVNVSDKYSYMLYVHILSDIGHAILTRNKECLNRQSAR